MELFTQSLCLLLFICTTLNLQRAINGEETCKDGYHIGYNSTCEPCPPGNKCINGTVEECEPGTYQDESGQSSCISCAEGYHQPDKGMLSCIPCSFGMFCNNTLQAHPCPAGTYQPFLASGACFTCGPGSYQPNEGSDHCLRCPADYACPAGSTELLKCTFGTANHLDGAEGCLTCSPPTQYIVNGTCQNCPLGFDCRESNRLPLPCAPGTLGTGGLCSQCSAGYYQPKQGQANCLPCPPGHTCSDIGMISPTPCPQDTYQSSFLSTAACTACPKGYFTNSTGSTDCLRIPDGFELNSDRVLVECKQGYASQGQGSCTQCTASFYQNSTGQSSCLPCPPGHICPKPGTTDPTPCPEGSYHPRRYSSGGSEACSPCPKGHYCPFEGILYPTPCPKGEFQAKTGQTSCYACPPETYQMHSASAFCYGCPQGYICNKTDEEPVKAPPGTAVPSYTRHCYPGFIKTNGACQICPAGSYSEDMDSSRCIDCPYGYMCPLDGLSAPIVCPAGSVGTSTRQTSCQLCPVGTFQNWDGTDNCNSCPPGHYCPTGSSEPIPCAKGEFQHSSGQGSCVKCQAGTYQKMDGQTQCYDCPAGSYCPEGTVNPIPCPPKQYNSATKQAACATCSVGFMCPTQGLVNQIPCPPGTFQYLAGQTSCSPCPLGTYSLGANQTCSPCPVGSMCPETNKKPTACPTKTYQDSENQIGCKPCPIAKSTGTKSCDLTCPAGYYCRYVPSNKMLQMNTVGGAPQEALDYVMYQCPPGSFSPAGAMDYYPCQAGQYASGYANSACSNCGEGVFCPGMRMSEPLPCPNGYSISCVNEPGCRKCPPGKESGSGASQCNGPPTNPDNDNPLLDCGAGQTKCAVDLALDVLTDGGWAIALEGADAITLGQVSELEQWLLKKGIKAIAEAAASSKNSKRDLAISTSFGKRDERVPKISMLSASEHSGKFNAGLDAIKRLKDIVDQVADKEGKIEWKDIAGDVAGIVADVATIKGKDLPGVCFGVEAASPECLKTMGMVYNGISDMVQGRKKRSEESGLSLGEALMQYRIATMPFMLFFRKHMDYFQMYKESSSACQTNIRAAFSQSESDNSSFVSETEFSGILATCTNGDKVKYEKMIRYFNDSIVAIQNGQVGQTFLFDLIHGYINISNAIDPNKPFPASSEVSAKLMELKDKIQKNAIKVETEKKLALTNGKVQYWAIGLRLPKGFQRGYVMGHIDTEGCSEFAVEDSPGLGYKPLPVSLVKVPVQSGNETVNEIYTFDAVTGPKGYLFKCKLA